MLPDIVDHHFTIQGAPYQLLECGRGGQERYRREFALAIAAAPGILDSVDGINLLAQAVARQCLRQAPEVFWKSDVTIAEKKAAQANGHLWELVTFEDVPLTVWEEFRQQVDFFMVRLPQPRQPDTPAASEPGTADTDPVETPEAVPAVFRGRAQ